MCPQCEVFAGPFKITEPDDYRNLAHRLIEAVNEKTLQLVKGDCPLEKLLEGSFPGDTLSHHFRCTMCSRRFDLHADTFHGHVEWEPQAVGEARNPTVQ
jgi:hypothetical protein